MKENTEIIMAKDTPAPLKVQKLSSLTSDEAAEIYLSILPDIEELINDSELKALLNKRKPPKDDSEATSLGKSIMLKIVAYLLKKRRHNVWNILAALNNTSPETVAEQNIVKTSLQLVGLITDRELISFFMLFMQLAQEL